MGQSYRIRTTPGDDKNIVIQVNYTDCNGDGQIAYVPSMDSINICAQQQSLYYTGPIQVLGGNTPCSVNGDCSTITTTTTTTNYC